MRGVTYPEPDYDLDLRFQPTLPVRGVTYLGIENTNTDKFQPTLPVRGVTHLFLDHDAFRQISTHTPRAGSDGYILQLTS